MFLSVWELFFNDCCCLRGPASGIAESHNLPEMKVGRRQDQTCAAIHGESYFDHQCQVLPERFLPTLNIQLIIIVPCFPHESRHEFVVKPWPIRCKNPVTAPSTPADFVTGSTIGSSVCGATMGRSLKSNLMQDIQDGAPKL